MCLAQGHNAVTPMRLKPAALRSPVNHSTSEPLCSQLYTHELSNGPIKILGKVTKGVKTSAYLRYSKTHVKRPFLIRQKIGFQNQGEHSAILSTFLKLPFVIKIFVLSILEWPFYTGFTVHEKTSNMAVCHKKNQIRASAELWSLVTH